MYKYYSFTQPLQDVSDWIVCYSYTDPSNKCNLTSNRSFWFCMNWSNMIGPKGIFWHANSITCGTRWQLSKRVWYSSLQIFFGAVFTTHLPPGLPSCPLFTEFTYQRINTGRQSHWFWSQVLVIRWLHRLLNNYNRQVLIVKDVFKGQLKCNYSWN